MNYAPLKDEVRATLPTPEAAYHLNRKPQTLRLWACNKDGPLKPINVGGRLHWSVKDMKELLGVE